MDDVRARYAEAAGLDPADPAVELDVRGNRSVVLVHRPRRLVWRFPTHPEDLPSMVAAGQRAQAAADLGLPAPHLVAAHPEGGLGRAHLVFTYVPGIAMDDPRVVGLPAERRERLGRDLADLLVRLRDLAPTAWPGTWAPWPQLWSDMADRVRQRVLPLVDPGGADLVERALVRAVATAHDAPASLNHGDLGGVNVRVDLADGRITGVLDWDGSIPGDVAVDAAAVHAGVPASVWDAVVAAEPVLVDDLARHDDYLATWPAQEVLWGLDHGNDALVRDGLHRIGVLAGQDDTAPA
ncbi:MAG: phosphotransferase [Candidatus Nanopelagicales bacterium]